MDTEYLLRLSEDERAEYLDAERERKLLRDRDRELTLAIERLKKKAMGQSYRFQLSGEPT